MSQFNPAHQTSSNGPLSIGLRERIQKLREKNPSLTLATLGQKMAISGPFLSTLLRDGNPGSVRSKHVERIAAAVAKLETEEGLSSPAGNGMEYSEPPEGSLDDLIRLANSKGFAVTFTPLPME